jgi:hypothetical protein
MITSPRGLVTLALFGLTLPFTLLGAYRNLVKDLHYVLFILLTLAVAVVFPIPADLRLIFPLFPFYFYFTFLGLMQAEAFLRRKRPWQGLVMPSLSAFREETVGWWKRMGQPVRVMPSLFVRVFGGIVLAFSLFTTSVGAKNNMKNGRQNKRGPFTSSSQEMLAFIRESTPSEAEIIFLDPRALSLFTQRQSLRVTDLAAIEAGKGDFFVYEYGARHFQITLGEMEQLRARFPVRFENKQFVVFQLKNLP